MSKLKHTMLVVLGHVDHGKSTLLGRLLADTDSLPEGKLEQIEKYCQDHKRKFEYAFLLDALKTERQQGITLDTARTYIKTQRSWLTIIDVPGHRELIRNMVSGADRAEYGLLVIDAKRGIQENTKRHCSLAHFLGIKQLIVCINKMDKVEYSRKVYLRLVQEIEKYINSIGVQILAILPISASDGVNIISYAQQTPWYKGRSLLAVLDTLSGVEKKAATPFRFSVQDTYAFEQGLVVGTITSGKCSAGDRAIIMPCRERTRIMTIKQWPHKKQKAVAGEAVGLVIKQAVSPGDILCHEKHPCLSGNRFSVLLLWVGKKPVPKNKDYIVQTLTNKVTGRIHSMEKTLHDIALCELVLNRIIAVDNYMEFPETGRLTFIEDSQIVGVALVINDIKD